MSERLYMYDDSEMGIKSSRNKRDIYRHKARYHTCGLLYRGRVLHLGCGSGYGRDIINENPAVTEIVSVDKDEEATAYCGKYYGSVPGYVMTADVTSADDMGVIATQGPWDTIVMIELFEHLSKEDQDVLVRRCRDMLTPHGKLIVSTPVGEDGPNPDNPHHLHERSLDTLYTTFPNYDDVFTMGSHLMTDGHAHEIAFVVAG